MDIDFTKTCRVCLVTVLDNSQCYFLNTDGLMLKSKLLDLLQGMDIEYAPNAIVCQQCTKTIDEIHNFKQLLIRTENVIKNLRLQRFSFNNVKIEVNIKEELEHDFPEFEQHDLHIIKEEDQTEPIFYYCHDCSYNTDDKKNLIQHVLLHKANKCNVCNRLFKSKATFNQHLRTHTSDKPYKCDQCNYCTIKKSSLKIHMHKHTGEKPFRCNKCSYRTAYNNHFKTHLLRHVDDKPFKCEDCPFETVKKWRLNAHLRTHTEVKPFKCNLCGYRTAYSSNLNAHLFIHTGKKPFKCGECGYCSTRKYDVKRHISRHH